MLPNAYEPEVTAVLQRYLQPGDVFVDAGASIGFHTRTASKLVGEAGLVFAFEPQAESLKHLVRHVHVDERLNNVAILKCALWKCDVPELELFSVKDIGYSSLYRYANATGSELVEARALDTLLIHYHPRAVKVDTEGTEAEVLCGAHNMLARGVDAVILEFNYHLLEQTGRSDRVIREYMSELGYEMYLLLGDGHKRPVKVALHQTIKLENGFHINVMFSTEEKVKERWSKTSVT